MSALPYGCLDCAVRVDGRLDRCSGCEPGPNTPETRTEPTTNPKPQPRACPRCGRWLKSGRHRGACPGRRRRRARSRVTTEAVAGNVTGGYATP